MSAKVITAVGIGAFTVVGVLFLSKNSGAQPVGNHRKMGVVGTLTVK